MFLFGRIAELWQCTFRRTKTVAEPIMASKKWSQAEYVWLTAACVENQRFHLFRTSYAVLAYYAGLQLDEILALETAVARAAISCGHLTFTDSLGVRRQVSINEPMQIQLKALCENAGENRLLFGASDMAIEPVRKDIISFCKKNFRKAAPLKKAFRLHKHPDNPTRASQ